jgi:predicted GH43/DUF377 family glycosyl hydrolase
MKNNLLVILLSFLFLAGCSKNNTLVNTTPNSTGGITFKIDRSTVPSGVTLISAALTRTGYETIIKNLNLLSDSTAEVMIPAVAVGTWHLKIDAKDLNNKILYTGETDVIVQENIIVQLNLTLNPVSSGTGSIYIFVTWGTTISNQWTDYSGNPLLTKNNNPSISNGVAYGRVLYDNGLYKMWYIAVYNGGMSSVWYAESQNGLNWNTIGNSPVMTAGPPGSWDSDFAVPLVVLKDNNQYKIYYAGCSSNTGPLATGLATSIDGIHWEKYSNNPVIQGSGQYYALALTEVIKKDSMYIGYLSYNNVRPGPNEKIGMATSYNGINWVMYSGNPILTATLPWEGGSIHCPGVIIENNIYKMVYGNTFQQNAFGMATSTDGINFVKQAEPIFKAGSTINNLIQTSYPHYRRFNNVSYIYYTGVNNSGEESICVVRNFED